ncbi:MAG TPA: CARDB domain-containing protein, partial [Candidatus Kapabacteria bacterium]|nr:CARDB domain-containing protein [Candidatus Kapabacteria bacterium]
VYFIVKEDNNIIYEMMFDTIPREYRDTLYFNITFNSVGIHAVSSYIDPNNLIDESKPYDNRKSNNHKILEIPVYPDLPDLSINTSPWGWGFAYPNPYPGKAYSLPVRVHNISCPNSPPNYLVYTTYKDGELVRRDTVIVPAINGLHWVDVHLNNYIFNETGIYTIYIDVNPDESFAEITYENNHIVRNVEVFEAKADLSLYHPIYGVYFDISNTNPAYPGGNLTFYQKIWNFGVVPAENFAVRFYIDNIQVGDSVIVPLLNPGGNYVVSSPTWVVEDCGHEYKIIVDGMNKIKEYSKENNSYDKVIGKEFNVYFMGPYGFTKNLVVDVPIGTTYKIKPYFLNYGTFDAYNIPTYFAAPIYSRPNISYFKNKNGCVSFTEYYQSDVVDTVVVYVYVDKDENGNSTVCEIDDDNNWAKVTIRFYEPSTVTYYPDLEVFSHHINPSELNPDPGEAIDIYTSFKNRGRAPAENFPINFYVNSIQQGETVMFPYIGVYQESSAAATEPWSSEMIGAHIIRVKLNEDTTIIETDYLNNQASRAIIVGSAPDYLFSGYNNNSNDEIRGLYIDNHTYPYNLNIGEAYNIVAKVANNGRADATATVMFYLIEGEEQTLIDAIDISTTPNEAKTVITTWVATTRYGKIKCVIDNTYPQDYNILNNETYFDFGTLFEEELAVEVSASSYLLLAGESVTLNAEATGGAELYAYEWFATPGGYTTSLANFQIQLYETTTFFFEVTDFYTTLYDTLTIEVVGEITPPILVAPLNNSINLVLNPLLDWNEVSTATSYSLQVATDNQFDNLIVDLNNLLLTNYQLENLNYLTQYFWRVKAVKQEPIYIESEWSEIWNFTTESEEAPVQTISLINGWNLISSYIEPENPNIATIFSQINNLKIVKNPMGLIYDPTFGINQIGNWNMQHGYLVNVIGATSIDIIGEYIIPENTPINMISGWNTNSYLRTSPMAAPIALATIVPNLIIAKNGTGQIYHPAFGINTIGNLMPGKGYMFYMNSPSILTYPENSQKKGQDLAILTPSATNLIPVYSNTGNDATLFLFVDGKTQNCEVGVYNSNSELIGSGAIYNGVAAVTIWGDDDITTDIDGAIDNEQLIVKLFNTSKNEEIALTLNNIVDITTNTELNELTYKSNAIYTAKTTISSEGDLILSIRNTPNPFSTSTTFEYTVLNDSDVEILIYTTTGEQVAQVANSFHKAGRYSFVFESKDLANGVYQVILRSGNQRAMTMMIVEK